MNRLTRRDIIDVLESGESEIAEFKHRLSSDTSVARVLSAFANTNGGVLLIGISNDGEIVGVPEEDAKSTISRLSAIIDSMLPTPSQVGSVKVEGKNVVYVSVEKAPISYGPVLSSTGTAYARHRSDTDAVDLLQFFTPQFQQKIAKAQPTRQVSVFVATSFRSEEEPHLEDYYSAMQRAAKKTKLPLDLIRVDLVEGDYEISQEIMNQIEDADILIADFTLNPANVYFELGFGRGKGKRVIQTALKGTKLEFDVDHWRTSFYRNATELEKKLIPELKAAYSDVVGE